MSRVAAQAVARALLITDSKTTGLKRCDVAYCRFGINGFVMQHGKECAVLTLIHKDGTAAEENDVTYYVPAHLLVPGGAVVAELKAIQEAKNDGANGVPRDGNR